MALALYSKYMFYPGGGLASGQNMAVTLFGSNKVPAMFSDQAGTTPKPAVTDTEGLLSFYAAPGLYQVAFAGESFVVEVDAAETAEVTPGVFTFEQTAPATTWAIAHHFGIEPAVQVISNKANVADFSVQHTDRDSLVITFESPASGTARLRR